MPQNRITHLNKSKSSQTPSTSVDFLFYTSKLLGLLPYSISDYISKRKFEVSPFGNVFCIICCIFYAILYHFMMSGTMTESESKDKKVTSLTEVIGLIILYLEPFMMTIDIFASIINQSSFIDVFNRLHAMDERLANENVYMSYKFIKKFSITMILIAFLGEFGLNLMNLIIIFDQMLLWNSIGWMLTSIPLFINFTSKTWFLCLILFIRQRMCAINNHLSDIADSYGDKNIKIGKNQFFVQTVDFLRNEIVGGQKKTNFNEKFKNIQIVAPYKEVGRGKN